MDEVCRHCRGTPKKTHGVFRCKLCKLTDKDYRDMGLEGEVAEWAFLRETWLKCQRFRQLSTGISSLDNVIERLFGKPHESNWRNYKLFEELTNKKLRHPMILRGVAP